MPLLGMSQRASSGPRLVLFKSPTSRVRKLSAFRTFVASQVFFVRLVIGIAYLSGFDSVLKMLNAAGPNRRIKIAGRIKKTRGKISFITALRAASSAAWLLFSRIVEA